MAGMDLISRLPDELLVMILDCIPTNQAIPSKNTTTATTSIPIPLVCKRWHDVYEPILYRHVFLVHLDRDLPHTARRRRLLLPQLGRRPHVRRYVRSLYLIVNSWDKTGIQELCQIVELLPAVERVRLAIEIGRNSLELLPLLVALRALARLQALVVDGCMSPFPGDSDGDGDGSGDGSGDTDGPNLTLDTLVSHFGHRRLKHLCITWAPFSPGSPAPAAFAFAAAAAAAAARAEGGQAARSRSRSRPFGAVESLALERPGLSAAAMQSFLQLPVRLKSLVLRRFDHLSSYSVPAVQSMLDAQRGSLQKLLLGAVPGGGGGKNPQLLLDVSRFPALRWLHVASQNAVPAGGDGGGGKAVVADVYAHLQAPSLEHVTVQFGPRDTIHPTPEDFSPETLAWFEGLARLKQARNEASGNAGSGTFRALRSLYIEFQPAEGWHGWSQLGGAFRERSAAWPWATLRKAREACAAAGLGTDAQEPAVAWRLEDPPLRENEFPGGRMVRGVRMPGLDRFPIRVAGRSIRPLSGR